MPATQEIKKHFQKYENEIYRLVEGQYFISTRKLVDSDAEQELLESILDNSKPVAPTKNSKGNLHYLLYTPFRYPPLKTGGRFHTRIEQSIFYGSEELETSMAEIAFGRFLFMQNSDAKLEAMDVPYTHFMVKVKSAKSILLNKKPFDLEREKISHPSSYGYSQSLGKLMRDAGAELFTYFSARRKGGINVGLFSVEAFASNKPIAGRDKHWSVYITNDKVEFHRLHMKDNKKESHIFEMDLFKTKNKFPRNI